MERNSSNTKVIKTCPGYNTVSLMEMIQYLYDNYGVNTPEELEENDKRMREAYDPTKTIENLFEEIGEGVEYAEAGITTNNDKQILLRTYLLVRNTGMYNYACREWSIEDISEQNF
mmetsp:Transcript_23468/g.22509  ORF Transcript_23468/g.22509 Transcript_23468/m.22509 type:complete len:116 (-) Transcript_23468:136-483(-)